MTDVHSVAIALVTQYCPRHSLLAVTARLAAISTMRIWTSV